MKYKLIGYAVTGILLILGYLVMNALVASKKEPEKKDVVPTIKVVAVTEAIPQENPVSISINGKLESFNKLELFSEVGGRVLKGSKNFKEGVLFSKGEILISIDSRDTKAALIAQRSSFQTILTQILADLKLDYSDNFEPWNAYVLAFDPEKRMAELPKSTSDQEKRFLTTKNIYNTYYNIRSQELKLSKFSVSAPFNGVLSSSSIQYGSIIRPGQKLGDFIQPGLFELEAPVNIKDVSYLKPGNEVKLTSTDIAGNWTGKIARVGKNVDSRTQSVMVYITLNQSDLKEGMYLSGIIDASTVLESVILPRKLLNDDGSVFIVQDTVLKKIFPTVEKISESSIIFSGIPSGTKILSENFLGAYEGLNVSLGSNKNSDKKDSDPTNSDAEMETEEADSSQETGTSK